MAELFKPLTLKSMTFNFGLESVWVQGNVLAQRCIDMNYEKVSDKVNHKRFVKIFTHEIIDSRDLKIISQLYWKQTFKIRIDRQFPKIFKLREKSANVCAFITAFQFLHYY